MNKEKSILMIFISALILLNMLVIVENQNQE